MSTWAARLASDRKRLCLWFTIQGVDSVFLERDIDASTILGAARTELVNIVEGSLEIGQEEIDLDQLAHKGGSFRVRIKQRKGTTTLDDLFQTRKRRRTSVTTAISKTDTTVTVGDSTWAASDTGLIYLGNETIKHTTRPTSTSFGGLTRGMFGSRAQPHKGSGDWKGTAVYDVPPFWLGRRITLRASFLDDAGNTNATKTTTIGTFTINEDPRQVDSLTWELSAGPLSDEYAKRKLYVGLRDASGVALVRVSDTSPYVRIRVDEAGTFLPSPAGFVTHAMIWFHNFRRALGRVYACDIVSEPNYIDVLPDPGFFRPDGWPITLRAFTYVDKIRHVVFISGLPFSSLLPALCSELGDGANGSFDLLPGVVGASYGIDGWQMGAGIHEADIDTTAFGAITNARWHYLLDKTVSVGELLGEWALFAGAFWYVNVAGQLSCQRQNETTAASVMTLDASVIVGDTPPTTTVEESSIYPTIEISTNYNPSEQDFLVKHVFQDSEMMRRYSQRHDMRRVEAKGIAVDVRQRFVIPKYNHPAVLAEEELRHIARGWQKAEGRGRLIVHCTTRLKGLKANLGDVVTIGFAGSDHEGGSISGREARVIARRPRFKDGRVDFVLQVLEPLYLFAPTGVVTAVTTTTIANDTVTLSTTAPDVASTTPSRDFVVGQTVRLWDVSAGTSQVLTIASIPNNTQLVFTSGVTGTVETGVDWFTWNTLGTNTAAGSTANGHNEGDWAFLMGDSAVPAAGGVRRWR